jgi:hypothetical protein
MVNDMTKPLDQAAALAAARTPDITALTDYLPNEPVPVDWNRPKDFIPDNWDQPAGPSR